MEIIGQIQTYSWGKIGSSSLVAQLYKKHITIDEETTYAELWMGTHPNGSSQSKEYHMSLLEIINQQPALLGKIGYHFKYDGLPFLLKVLSINKALSIQVHPDKDMAALLHQNFKALYPDANHKPEMAIALTDFRALSGFRPLAEIKEFCVNVTELEMVITPHLVEEFRKKPSPDLLNKLLFSLLTKEGRPVDVAVETFLARYEYTEKEEQEKVQYSLVKQLFEQFPGDSGVFMAFFLNDVHLKPGEALFIPSGLPHAYLYGDCVECMASSDNVVRAGLTPKYKDIDTLLKILDYKSYSPNGVKIKPVHLSPCSTRYNAPIPEFGVTKVSLEPEDSWVSPSHDSCQIFIVIEGEGTCVGPKLIPFERQEKYVAPKIDEEYVKTVFVNKEEASDDEDDPNASSNIPPERALHGIKEMGVRESYRLHELYSQPSCILHNMPPEIVISGSSLDEEDVDEQTSPVSKTQSKPNVLQESEIEEVSLPSRESQIDDTDLSDQDHTRKPRIDDMSPDSSSDSTIIGEQYEISEWALESGTVMFFPPYSVYKIVCHESPLLIFFAYTNSNFTYPKFPHPKLPIKSAE